MISLDPRALRGPLLDAVTSRYDRAGLAAERRRQLAPAAGVTVEIGAGTGANLPHYPAGLPRLVLVEPDVFLLPRLRRKAAAYPAAEVVRARAEALPLPDGSADTVVSTAVLCSVADPAAAAAEIRRILRPGGRLLFYEHVLAGDEALARRQHRWARPWGMLSSGCHPDRDTLAVIAAALGIAELRQTQWPNAPALIRPVITGVATRGPGPPA